MTSVCHESNPDPQKRLMTANSGHFQPQIIPRSRTISPGSSNRRVSSIGKSFFVISLP